MGRLNRLIAIGAISILLAAQNSAMAKPPVSNKTRTSHNIRLQIATLSNLKSVLKSDQGHPVLINFWATWCGPCVAEFPDIVSLSNHYKRQGLRLITISADEPNSRSAVLKFLVQHHTPQPCFIKPAGDNIAAAKKLDPHFDGALPHTYLLDKKGKVKYSIEGRVDTAKLKTDIIQLLKEK